MAVRSGGEIYIVDTGNHRIQVLGADGTFRRKWGKKGDGPGQLDRPHAVALDSKGRVYIASHGNRRIQKFTPEGKLIAHWNLPDPGKEGRHEPTKIILFGAKERLLVPDPRNHRIVIFDAEGKLQLTFGKRGKGQGEFDRPTGVALDGQGYLYVCDSGNHRIQRFRTASWVKRRRMRF